MPDVHDRGGRPTSQPIDKADHQLSDWERRTDAIVQVLGRKDVLRTDELRRAIEALPQERYETLAYYERWADALLRLTHEKGLVTPEELERKVAEYQRRESLA
jgi:hypothetical protein